MNLPALQAEARLRNDIKATTTIALTVAAYFICYVPSIVYAVVGLQEENQTEIWFGFIAWYSLYISSAVNPVIYYLRTSRFRSAFKQFLKDPFGSSDFKQKPTGAVRGRKGKIEVKWRKNNNEKAVGPCGVQPVDGSEPREKYPSERRNAMVILSTDNLQDHSGTFVSLVEVEKFVMPKGKGKIIVHGNITHRTCRNHARKMKNKLEKKIKNHSRKGAREMSQDKDNLERKFIPCKILT